MFKNPWAIKKKKFTACRKLRGSDESGGARRVLKGEVWGHRWRG